MRDKNKDRVNWWLSQGINPIETGELSLGEAMRMMVMFEGDSRSQLVLAESDERDARNQLHPEYERIEERGANPNRVYEYRLGQQHFFEDSARFRRKDARNSRTLRDHIVSWINKAEHNQKQREVASNLKSEYPKWMVKSSVPGRPINHSLGDLSYTPYIIHSLSDDEIKRGVGKWLCGIDAKSPGVKNYARGRTKWGESWAGYTDTCLPIRWVINHARYTSSSSAGKLSRGRLSEKDFGKGEVTPEILRMLNEGDREPVYVVVETEVRGIMVITGEPLFMQTIKKIESGGQR